MARQSFRERMKIFRAMADAQANPTTKPLSTPPTKEIRESRLWSLICLAREVGSDVDDIRDYTNLIDEKKRLERQLGERSQEALSLKQELAQVEKASENEISMLTQTFGERYKLFDENKKNTETLRIEAEKLRVELKAAAEKEVYWQKKLKTLESNTKTMKNTHNQLQQKCERLEKDCIVHRSRLQAAEAEVSKFESKLKQANAHLGRGYFLDIDETRELRLRENLQMLSSKSHAIAEEFLSNCEFDMTGPLFRRLQAVVPNLPLPSGASKEAVLMRRALGQAVICSALVTHIFRPFYILEDFSKAADYMIEFFEENEQQHIYRHQILKVTDDAGIEAVMEVAAKGAAHDVSGLLDRLVLTASVENFRREVEDYFYQAAKMWYHQVQRASDLVEVTTPQSQDKQLGSYPEFGSRNVGNGVVANRDIAAILFPRISVNEMILHEGMVLWADAPAAMTAKDQIPSSPVGRSGTIGRRARRNSLVGG